MALVVDPSVVKSDKLRWSRWATESSGSERHFDAEIKVGAEWKRRGVVLLAAELTVVHTAQRPGGKGVDLGFVCNKEHKLARVFDRFDDALGNTLDEHRKALKADLKSNVWKSNVKSLTTPARKHHDRDVCFFATAWASAKVTVLLPGGEKINLSELKVGSTVTVGFHLPRATVKQNVVWVAIEPAYVYVTAVGTGDDDREDEEDHEEGLAAFMKYATAQDPAPASSERTPLAAVREKKAAPPPKKKQKTDGSSEDEQDGDDDDDDDDE